MLLWVLNIFYVLIAIAMIALILMQRGAGAQAGSGFGGGASSTVFGSRGASNFLSKSTKWLAVAFWVGGLILWARRIIGWQIPMAFLAGLVLAAGLLHFVDAGRYGSPLFHFFAPSVALAAFFIATDPVSGATTPRGKLIFGFGAGVLTIVIRTWGGFPDGVAFAILLMNLSVPLIDQYTQPRIYGEARAGREPRA